MKKYLHVIVSMNPIHGGVCQAVRTIVKGLNDVATDIESNIVCLDNEESNFLDNESFKIFALGTPKSPWAYNAKLLPWLQSHMSSYDVVIIHGLWSYTTYAVNKVATDLRKRNHFVPRVYVMPHGMLDPWFQKDKRRKFKAIRNNIYWHLIEKSVINNSYGLLFTCEQELLLARDTFKGYKPRRELNVGLGIESPPVFSHFPYALDKPYLLFLSRINPKKGVDLLIDAFNQLCEYSINIPDLVIAGPTDSEFARAMIEKAKSNNKIHFVGMLQGDAKWGAIYGCEAFILPSHQENFGIAVVEALACEKPVLITNQINIFKEIEAANAGFIEEDTIQGVKNLLNRFLKLSVNEKSDMSLNARNLYLSSFDILQTAARFLNAINMSEKQII